MTTVRLRPLRPGFVAAGLATLVIGALTDAGGQAPGPPPIEGNVHTATYVEVMPTSATPGLAELRRYREATRKEDGNLRCELVSRIGQPHQLVILEVWKDQKAWEAHGRSANAASLREKVQAIRNAPTDERVHVAVSMGPLAPGPAGDAVYVVTHVDVIPPRKDDGLAALKQLGDDSRSHAGNVRFEVVQQTNRPNHFTVVEIWKDARALEAHSMAEATRRFRDKLGPMSGALYDERFFRSVD
jgi:quinol monooxygenase YgiN